jgi:hypothetical protein
MKGDPLSSDQSQIWKSHVTNVSVGHEIIDVTEARSTQESQKKLGARWGTVSVILCMWAPNSTGQDRNVKFTTFLLIVR